MTWNPWKRIRELETTIAVLNERLQYETEEADRRIGHSIAAHYTEMEQRNRYRDALLAQTQQSLLDITSVSPLHSFAFREPK